MCRRDRPYRNIEYIEGISKTIYFYLTGGGKKEVHGSLAEYEQVLLGRPEFFKVHRSYLVNLSWVAEVRRGELLTTSGSRVPISRSAYQRVRTAYTEFLFEDADKAIHSGGKG